MDIGEGFTDKGFGSCPICSFHRFGNSNGCVHPDELVSEHICPDNGMKKVGVITTPRKIGLLERLLSWVPLC